MMYLKNMVRMLLDYILDGPAVKAGDLKFNEKDIETVVKNVNILMYNMVTYLLQMIDLYQIKLNKNFTTLIDIENQELITNP